MKKSMRSYTLILLLLVAAKACSVNKHQLWKCLVEKGDSNNDQRLEADEIRKLVKKNTFWYERLIKSPDSVVKQIEDHCSLPLTYGHLLQPNCFRHCGGLEGKRTIYHRLCPR